MACRYRDVACAREAAAYFLGVAPVEVVAAVEVDVLLPAGVNCSQADVFVGLQNGEAVWGGVADCRCCHAEVVARTGQQ